MQVVEHLCCMQPSRSGDGGAFMASSTILHGGTFIAFMMYMADLMENGAFNAQVDAILGMQELIVSGFNGHFKANPN